MSYSKHLPIWLVIVFAVLLSLPAVGLAYPHPVSGTLSCHLCEPTPFGQFPGKHCGLFFWANRLPPCHPGGVLCHSFSDSGIRGNC